MKKFNLDIWRFVVCFFIVAIHISPFADISLGFDFFITRVLGRLAVPLFLMITGYFILDKAIADRKVLDGYIKKILKIYLICIILYLPINIYMGRLKGLTILGAIKGILISGTFYHLWYFPALILGLFISYLLLKNFKKSTVFVIVLFLYVLGLFGDSYYGLIANTGLASFYNIIFKVFDYTRNGLFFVPIFLYLGYVIKTFKKSKWDTKNLLGFIFTFCFMTGEAFLLRHYDLQRHDSMYILLIPACYFMFRYLVLSSKGSNRYLRSLATDIYILHPLVIVLVRFASKAIGLKNIIVSNNLVFYIVVVLGTVCFAMIFEKIKGLWQKKHS